MKCPQSGEGARESLLSVPSKNVEFARGVIRSSLVRLNIAIGIVQNASKSSNENSRGSVPLDCSERMEKRHMFRETENKDFLTRTRKRR